VAGIMSVVIFILLYFINPGWIASSYGIINILLSIILLIVAIRLWTKTSTLGILATESFQRPPSRLSWITASVAGGLVAAIFSYQTIAIALSMVLIDVVMVEELDKITAPPPGLDWLIEIIGTHFRMQPTIFIAILVIGIGIGGLVGWLISIWAPKNQIE